MKRPQRTSSAPPRASHQPQQKQWLLETPPSRTKPSPLPTKVVRQSLDCWRHARRRQRGPSHRRHAAIHWKPAASVERHTSKCWSMSCRYVCGYSCVRVSCKMRSNLSKGCVVSSFLGTSFFFFIFFLSAFVFVTGFS